MTDNNSENNQTNDQNAPTQEVKREAYDAVSKDMHRFKEEATRLKKQIEDIEAEKLRKNGEWQQLAEKAAQERDDFRKKFEGLNQSIIDDKKFGALKEAALALGLRKEAVSDLDTVSLSEISHELTDKGRINIFGARAVAEQLKLKRPHWFSQPGSVNVNGYMPEGSTGNAKKITEADVIKASLEAQKSGNYDGYKKMLSDFQKQ